MRPIGSTHSDGERNGTLGPLSLAFGEDDTSAEPLEDTLEDSAISPASLCMDMPRFAALGAGEQADGGGEDDDDNNNDSTDAALGASEQADGGNGGDSNNDNDDAASFGASEQANAGDGGDSNTDNDDGNDNNDGNDDGNDSDVYTDMVRSPVASDDLDSDEYTDVTQPRTSGTDEAQHPQPQLAAVSDSAACDPALPSPTLSGDDGGGISHRDASDDDDDDACGALELADGEHPPNSAASEEPCAGSLANSVVFSSEVTSAVDAMCVDATFVLSGEHAEVSWA